MTTRLRILTWHVHGNYLYSLTQLPHDFIIPVMPDNRAGYAAIGAGLPWGSNVKMVPASAVHRQKPDCIIYQSDKVYRQDRDRLLSAEQRELPCVYIEHNPPEPHPTNTRHFFRHDRGVLVHVTHYNALMWDSGDVPVAVIEHGVPLLSAALYDGSRQCGITVINHLGKRGRRLGADIYDRAFDRIPLELIGMGSEELRGGLGEVPNRHVPAFLAPYRFFFSPIRYASLGLSLLEAMMVGLPVVGIAATELNQIVRNGTNGYVDHRPDKVFDVARQLLNEPELAHQWGEAARSTARERFNIRRFIDDWETLLFTLTEKTNA